MKNIIKFVCLILISILPINLFAQATSLPLLQIGDLEYEGAFAIPADNNGVLGANYSAGTLAYNSANSSLFLAGHVRGAAVAEYSIPTLVNSTDLAALNTATILQDFRQVLPYTRDDGHINEINEISGMAVINGKLAVNAIEYYDADANNTDTGVVLQNPADIANSAIDGYYSLEGAAHAAGWLSPVPVEWQTLLGGNYIAGNSNKYSINSRLAIGISAFVFNPSDMTNAPPGTVPTTTLLDFDLSNPLHADYNYENSNYNLVEINGDNSFTGHTFADADATVGTNDLWTEISQASYGFIVPGTRTYLSIGSSGGHNMGIGYKPTQSDGNVCGGPCPYDADDRYNYYWLWDVNDLLAVKNGVLNAYDVRPYDYGVFNVPFQTDVYTQTPEFHAIMGGTYDADNGILYLAIWDGASTGAYDRVPAIAAYSTSSSSCPVAGTTCDDGNPNTTNDVEDGFCQCSGTPVSSGCELLTNPNFDTDLTGWLNWGCTAQAIGGIANLTNIIPNTTNIWEVAFMQPDVIIEQGEDYDIKFSARADANRPLHILVQLDGPPYTTYYQTTVNLTTSMQNYSLSFTMSEPTDYNTNFMFYMGGNDVNTYIDNASLEKVNCGTTPPSTAQCECPDVAETGNVVTVQNVTELQNAISQANTQNGNMTIKVEPGVYQLNNGFVISPNMSNLTVMGTSGNRDDVFIKGQGYNGGTTAIFLVQADNFSVAHMTVGEVSTHGIQIQGEQDADDFTAVNVRFVDINEQFLKVSGGTSGSSFFSDRGRVFCCEFEFTAGIGYQFYTGGIDCHKSKDWIIHNNVFKGIRSPDGTLAEHAIHFWQVCENTIVTSNKISNCDRGIGFGLGNDVANGHVGGLIMNNFVHTNRDVGIGLEYSPDTKVYNNTVITDNYSNSIEYRFLATTNVSIINNLVSGNIALRSGAPPATTSTNYTLPNLNIFADATNYDYHLVGTPAGIVDAGTILSEVNVDIDCENRIGGAGMDIGADEVGVITTCPPIEILTGNTTSNSIYHAGQTVSSDATINADVIYKAGNEIELKSGFSTNPANNFTGEIEDCNGN